MIPRLTYLTRLEQVRDKQIIKVLTGVRRAGKSTILTMYQAWLKEHGVHPNQIQAINFEDLAFSELKDYEKLLSSSVLEYKMTKCTSKWTTFFILTYIPNYIQNDL